MKPTDTDRANVIATKIQNYINGEFEKERSKENRRTKWNNQIMPTLAAILAQCEMTRKKARNGASNSSFREVENYDQDLN